MPANDFAFATAAELSAALADRKVSSLELTDDVIARIERLDTDVNAICVRDFDRARDAAKEADAKLARGENAPLLGIPMNVKESFNVAGLPTTWGFPDQKDFIAREDALAIQRVKNAGAVIVGKTNVPVALSDWQSYNDIYGVTKNPYDLSRTPGGSSGGSSAALAAGFGALSLGSDIGGSLRVPAHYCGIYAHKPTFNLAPLRGHTPPPYPPLPFERDLSVIGPMARSAEDCAHLLDVIAGPDEIDMGVGYRLDLPPPRHDRLSDFRILVLDTHPDIATASVIRVGIADLASHLEKSGARVARQSDLVPDLAANTRLYMRMLLGFLGATMPPEVYAGAIQAAAQLPTGDVSLGAERLRGIALSHREWIACNAGRTRLRAAWRDVFKSFDAVICPVMSTPAYPHDHAPDQELRKIDIDGVAYPYSDMLAWPGIATLPGLPATAIPLPSTGLPFGVQIVGPWLEDRTPLRLATLIAREIGGFVAPKGFV